MPQNENNFTQQIIDAIYTDDQEKFTFLCKLDDEGNSLIELNQPITQHDRTGTVLMHVLYHNGPHTKVNVEALLALKDSNSQPLLNLNILEGMDTAMEIAQRLGDVDIIERLRNAGAQTREEITQSTHSSLANATVALSIQKLKLRYPYPLEKTPEHFIEIVQAIEELKQTNPALKTSCVDVLKLLQDNLRMSTKIVYAQDMTAKEAICYVWSAIFDKNARCDDQIDLPEDELVKTRLETSINEIARIANEYGPGRAACTQGTFNGIVASLNPLHPDVFILPTEEDFLGAVRSSLSKLLNDAFAEKPLAIQLQLLKAWNETDSSTVEDLIPECKNYAEILKTQFAELLTKLSRIKQGELTAKLENWCRADHLVQIDLTFPEAKDFTYITKIAERLGENNLVEINLYLVREATLELHLKKLIEQTRKVLGDWFTDHPIELVKSCYIKLSLQQQTQFIDNIVVQHVSIFSFRGQPIFHHCLPYMAQKLSEIEQKTLLENIKTYLEKLTFLEFIIVYRSWPTDTKILLLQVISQERLADSVSKQTSQLEEALRLLSSDEERLTFLTRCIEKLDKWEAWLSIYEFLSSKGSYYREFMQASSSKLKKLINSADSLLNILKKSASKKEILQALSPYHLQEIIKDEAQLITILTTLPSLEDQEFFLNKIGNNLKIIIKAPREFIWLLNRLDSKIQKILLIMLGQQRLLGTIALGYGSLWLALSFLSPELHGIFLENLGAEDFRKLIKNSGDLNSILGKIAPLHYVLLLNKLDGYLRTLINEKYQLSHTLRCLQFTEAQILLLTTLGNTYLIKIISGENFQNILSVTSSVVSKPVHHCLLEQLGEHLKTIIADDITLSNILKMLEPDNQKFLLIKLGEYLKTIINSHFDLSRILEPLTPANQKFLLEHLGNHLKKIIKSDWQREEILKTLAKEDHKLLSEILPATSEFHDNSENRMARPETSNNFILETNPSQPAFSAELAINEAIEDIGFYLKNELPRLNFFVRFFEGTSKKQQATLYGEELKDNKNSINRKLIYLYALLASKDSNSESVRNGIENRLKDFRGTYNSAREALEGYIKVLYNNDKQAIEKVNDVVGKIVSYANTNPKIPRIPDSFWHILEPQISTKTTSFSHDEGDKGYTMPAGIVKY